MAVAIQKTNQNSSSMRCEFGPAGSKVVNGWSPVSRMEHDARTRVAPTSPTLRVNGERNRAIGSASYGVTEPATNFTDDGPNHEETSSKAMANSVSRATPWKAAATAPCESVTKTQGSEGRPHSVTAGTGTSSSKEAASMFS